eukprot:8094664-Pyramimonas_sp.AAC.1
MARGRHANPATGAFGRAPCGATVFVRGVPPCRWGLRWSPLWGRDPNERCAEMARGRHANPATG